jgi:hypothetical protein
MNEAGYVASNKRNEARRGDTEITNHHGESLLLMDVARCKVQATVRWLVDVHHCNDREAIEIDSSQKSKQMHLSYFYVYVSVCRCTNIVTVDDDDDAFVIVVVGVAHLLLLLIGGFFLYIQYSSAC